ncbi:MAG: hypothetical protein BWY59_00186 [Verrucomicrobia bacterium ADurb.Bin345]|nr:MAG: hypothetical protein BWY59_00186 [Verrucomicrobia bacterium ADurb.Bin345]
MFVTSVAAFQSASPACEATTLTAPMPLNVRFVPPVIVAGPLPTAKLTGRPLEAVAERRAVPLTAKTLPLVGRNSEMTWSALTYSKPLSLTDSPWPAENTRTSPRPVAAAAPATTTICVGDWPTTAALTPHSVTLVASVPSQRFVPEITTW